MVNPPGIMLLPLVDISSGLMRPDPETLKSPYSGTDILPEPEILVVGILLYSMFIKNWSCFFFLNQTHHI